MISHKYKCIFIHIPKCAGTSIEAALGHHDQYSGPGMQDHRTLAQIEPWSLGKALTGPSLQADIRRMYMALRQSHNPANRMTVTRDQYDSYFRFSIVRDPWSRAVSWYKNVLRDKAHQRTYNKGLTSFGAFMAHYAGKRALRPQTFWLCNRAGEIDLDHIGRFENISDEFEVIRERLGAADLQFPWLIKSDKKEDISHHLDERTDALIRSVYAREIELFSFRSPLD